MPSLALLVVAAFAAPSPAAIPVASYAGDTIAHSKGHIAVAARTASPARSAAPTVCNPDPSKGRACRHHVAKTEEARAERSTFAVAETAQVRD